MKRFVVLMALVFFVFGVVAVAFSSDEVKGTITKIDGNKLTIKQADGKEVTVEVKDPKGLKVGDTVEIENKVAKKVKKKKKVIEGC